MVYDAHDCQRGITLLSVTANGGCGQACVNESQIEEASPPISGTFTVANSNGGVTKDIPVTASAAEFKQFLEEIHDGVSLTSPKSGGAIILSGSSSGGILVGTRTLWLSIMTMLKVWASHPLWWRRSMVESCFDRSEVICYDNLIHHHK